MDTLLLQSLVGSVKNVFFARGRIDSESSQKNEMKTTGNYLLCVRLCVGEKQALGLKRVAVCLARNVLFLSDRLSVFEVFC